MTLISRTRIVQASRGVIPALSLFISASLAHIPTAQSEIYRWTDADGNLHFGDTHPPRDNTDVTSVPSNVKPDNGIQLAKPKDIKQNRKRLKQLQKRQEQRRRQEAKRRAARAEARQRRRERARQQREKAEQENTRRNSRMVIL